MMPVPVMMAAAPFALFAIVVMIMVVMAAFVIIAVVVVMMTTFVIIVVVVVMMVMMFVSAVRLFLFKFLAQAFHFGAEGILLFHGGEDVLAREAVPGRRDEDGGGVMLPQHGNAGRELFLGNSVRMGKDDAAGALHLVVEKFAEILHVQLAFARVHDRAEGIEFGVFEIRPRHRLDDVAELAHAGRLDDDAVGVVFFGHLFKSLGEVADERAADAARIHLGDLNARVLQKAAVDADFAEFVFDEDDLLARICFFDEFFDERRLARAQKTGKYIDLCHNTPRIFINAEPRFSNAARRPFSNAFQNAQFPSRKICTRLPSAVTPTMDKSAEPIMKSTWIMLSLMPCSLHCSLV